MPARFSTGPLHDDAEHIYGLAAWRERVSRTPRVGEKLEYLTEAGKSLILVTTVAAPSPQEVVVSSHHPTDPDDIEAEVHTGRSESE